MDKMTLFRRIAKAQFDFPPYDEWMSHESRQLLQHMLQTDPVDRLGQQSPKVTDIKFHTWFQLNNIDFFKLVKKEVEAPWEPEMNDVMAKYHEKNVPITDMGGRPEGKQDTKTNEKPLTEQEQELFKDF
jgi:hypothetical protein